MANTSTDCEIKLIALDLDGTLLDDAKRISARTASALNHVRGTGVRVVIASARPPRSVRRVYADLGLDTWQINYNGALLWDEPGRRAVEHRPMESGVVREVVRFARKRHPEVLVSCEILDRWCTDRLDETYTTETGRLFRPDLVAPFEEFCVEPITKLMLLAAPAALTEMEPALRSMSQAVSVIRSDPDLIQVIHASASKGAALRTVCRHYGVATSCTMAIGDAANDVPMFEVAGVAVAMGNARENVKRVAHWVAPSNNEDGILAALVRFGLYDSNA